MKKAIFRTVSVILLILNMLLIFSLSAQEASESDELSDGFTYKVFSAFYPEFNEMTESEQAQTIAEVSFPIRKAAHFSIYCLLGVFSFMTFISYTSLSFGIRAVMSFLLCVMYASSDEIHQLFVKGRSGEARDVIIDSLGALLSIAVLSLITLKTEKFKEAAVKMRKKDLAEQNRLLFEKNRELNSKINELQNTLQRREVELNELKSTLVSQEDAFADKSSVEDTVKAQPEEAAVAVKAIGRVVVLCALYLNKLSEASYSDKKELINLILGKCEAAKSEILSVDSTNLSSEEATRVMEEIYKDAEEYMKSILAQTV